MVMGFLQWLQLRFDFNLTTVRQPFYGHSAAYKVGRRTVIARSNCSRIEVESQLSTA